MKQAAWFCVAVTLVSLGMVILAVVALPVVLGVAMVTLGVGLIDRVVA